MPIVGGDPSAYKVQPFQTRKDGDGKEWAYALAHGDLTARSAYVAYKAYDGWRTLALFDTGLASTSAASHMNFIAFVPDTAIGSGTYGWGQCGGVATYVLFDSASTSSTVGNPLIWSDATITGTTGITATNVFQNVYAINVNTTTNIYFDILLLGSDQKIYGTT